MTETGIIPYDLIGSWCEECGRAKSFRLWPGMLTGCKTCDEVITRHRCTGRPEPDDLDVGTPWTCPDCDSTWTVVEEAAWCSECGCNECRTEKVWRVSVYGDRIATAPRHDPPSVTPFRSIFTGRRPLRPGPFGECYTMAGGAKVHVRPGCRCKT